jgi:uncharacterized protein (DUF433 family)
MATNLHDLEILIGQLSHAEKAQILQWIAQDLGGVFPGIDHSPDVLGGEARIARTRIPVWLLVQARRLGSSEADILSSYPSLRAVDLANAWAYARVHSDEIERDIAENENA